METRFNILVVSNNPSFFRQVQAGLSPGTQIDVASSKDQACKIFAQQAWRLAAVIIESTPLDDYKELVFAMDTAPVFPGIIMTVSCWPGVRSRLEDAGCLNPGCPNQAVRVLLGELSKIRLIAGGSSGNMLSKVSDSITEIRSKAGQELPRYTVLHALVAQNRSAY